MHAETVADAAEHSHEEHGGGFAHPSQIIKMADVEAFLYEDDGRSTDYLEGRFCRSRFVWDGKSLSGEILAGPPLGTLRKIVVIFRSMIKPAHIALEGSGTIAFERQECGFRISLPELPADLAWKLNVAF